MHTFLETLRQKPEEVRHRIALLTAFGITLIIALGWLAALATSGKFAFITDADASAKVAQAKETAAQTTGTFSGLLGAASAAFTSSATEKAPEGLSVVDQDSSSTLEPKTATEDRTVIPF